MAKQFRPGQVRDAIVGYLAEQREVATVAAIQHAATARLGREVPASSVRSFLRLHTEDMFERMGRGQYRLRRR